MDPYPQDAANNTGWWRGGEFWLDGVMQNLVTDVDRAYNLTSEDRDADGLPDWVDPYPDDPLNHTAWWWDLAWVDGDLQDIFVPLSAGQDWELLSWADADDDGLPDWADPYSEDAENNTSWWRATGWVDGSLQEITGTFATTESSTISWEDWDVDGLPDWLDPYPQDATNNTAWWWDESWVDGELQDIIAAYATSQAEALNWGDRDFDGLPDWADPYPDDLLNNSLWWEGEFYIDGFLVTISGAFPDTGPDWSDGDGDWIPDFFDPYPTDPSNNTAFWTGTALIDGAEEEIAAPYPASIADLLVPEDTDGDSLPDYFDPYPQDATNNTSRWSGGDFLIDGVLQTLAGDGTAYATDLGDLDGDHIPDFADPYPADATNDGRFPGDEPASTSLPGQTTDMTAADGVVSSPSTVSATAQSTASTIATPLSSDEVETPSLPPTITETPSSTAAPAPAPPPAVAQEALAWEQFLQMPFFKLTPATTSPLPSVTTEDADGNGVPDIEEAIAALTDDTDPAMAEETGADEVDTDNDGLPDTTEHVEGTDPLNADTDGGGTDDKTEVENRRKLREAVQANPLLVIAGPIYDADPLNGSDDYHAPEEQPVTTEPEEEEEHTGDSPPENAPEQQQPNNDQDGDGFTADIDPDDGDPDIPLERDLDGDGTGHKSDPDDNDPTVPGGGGGPPAAPPGETLREKWTREREERAQQLQERRDRLHAKHVDKQEQRAAARQAQREINELLNHPHGNHGNGVKNAGARGTFDSSNRPAPFQPSANYALSHGYDNVTRTWANPSPQNETPQQRNDRLHEGWLERQTIRDEQLAQQRLLWHPHGNHGNGVINPGARGTNSALNPDGALAFQASESYAQTDAYKRQTFENQVKQAGRDVITHARLQEQARLQKARDEAGSWENMLKPRLADDIAQRGQEPGRQELHEMGALAREQALETLYQQALQSASGITPELLENNPGFASRWAAGQLDTILNGVSQPAGPPQPGNGGNVFSNLAVQDGGIGVAAGQGNG